MGRVKMIEETFSDPNVVLLALAGHRRDPNYF
jgi:hypothetical protein